MSDFQPLFAAAIEHMERDRVDRIALGSVLDHLCETVEIKDALTVLSQRATAPSTIASLYLGYRSMLVSHVGDWSLVLARIETPADKVSLPTGRSVTKCLSTAHPVQFDVLHDDIEWDSFDIRGPSPLVRTGNYVMGVGDFIVVDDLSHFAAPTGTIDAIFLKIEGPTLRPLSVAFDRETLAFASFGLADQRQTAGDFFASLLHTLLADTADPLQAHLSAGEAKQLTAYVAMMAADPDLHMSVRWKYIQALGRLSGPLAVAALGEIAARSTSAIGDHARRALSRHAQAAGTISGARA
jgi:hypothetical protein